MHEIKPNPSDRAADKTTANREIDARGLSSARNDVKSSSAARPGQSLANDLLDEDPEFWRGIGLKREPPGDYDFDAHLPEFEHDPLPDETGATE